MAFKVHSREEQPATSSGPFTIEKGIPIPDNRAYARIYPFDEMDAGDSFPLPDKESFRKAQSAALYYGRKHGKKFICRSCNGVHRIWRFT